jgi:hypothetical protein
MKKKTEHKEPLINSINQLHALKTAFAFFREIHKRYSFNRRSKFSLFVPFGAFAGQKPLGKHLISVSLRHIFYFTPL